jgi:xylose dehydrogenase (NAD/NADP)
VRKVRWGIISTANIGQAAVIPAIQSSRNGEVVALASRDARKATEFASKMSIPRICPDYEALLALDDIDVVYIPLPNSLHQEWAIKSAEAGKHILCEKPLALSSTECAEMNEASKRNGVKLMEAFMYRFHPRTQKVLDLVRSRAIGQLKLIHSSFTFRVSDPATNIRFRPELGGGALMDVGCYCVNICRTVAAAEPTLVQAIASWSVSGVDERMTGTIQFADGILAQFDCSLTMERREAYTVAGSEGYLEVPAAFLPGEKETHIYERHGRRDQYVHSIPGVNQYRLMVEHFSDCILNDSPVRYDPAEATANMRVIDALYRSARLNGQPQKV